MIIEASTHRPGKAEGQNYPGFVIPDRTPERKRIPSEDRRRSHSEAAGPRSGNPGLVFLQTNFEKRVALAPCALSIRGAPCTIATHAVGQLSVRVVHRQDLQLELSRSLRHLLGDRRVVIQRADPNLSWKHDCMSS